MTLPPADAAPDPCLPATAWTLRLLGAVELVSDEQPPRLLRLPVRAEAGLLARLVLAGDREQPRDALVESLWPGVAPEVGRNRLRQTLASLRRHLAEVLGREATDGLIEADRSRLRLGRHAVLRCDVLELGQADVLGLGPEPEAGRRKNLDELAAAFMPGHDDEWAQAQRHRLAAWSGRQPGEKDSGATPPLPLAAAPPLPRYATRALGLEALLPALESAVERERLVTLLGPGGAGKTRLAVELLHRLAHPASATATGQRWPRRAFVPLAACTERGGAATMLARHLGLARDAAAGLAGALAAVPTLLVLDNLEQFGPDAVAWVGGLLAAAPQLQLLATSRRPLGLDGEWRWPVPPLPSAGPAGAPGAAVELYRDRARAVRSPFGGEGALAAEEPGAIEALVQRLGGLPLAIELAATRAASFTPQQMLELLAPTPPESTPADVDRPAATPHLDLLQRPRGASAEERHGSMAEVLAWSWRLLDVPSQRLLAALAQIDGEATAATATAMLEEPLARTAARLDALAGHSLLRAVAETGAPRFALPEPVREFVRLHTPPALALRLRAALRRHLVAWAARHATGPLPAVAAELPAILSAIALATPDGVPEDGLRLALALRPYWDSDGHPQRLRSALEAALAAAAAVQAADPGAVPVVDPGLASDAHELLAYLQFEAGHAAAARRHCESALARAERASASGGRDAGRRARALARRAWIELAAARTGPAAGADRASVRNDLAEALLLAQAAGDLEAQARVHQQRSQLAGKVDGDLVLAEAAMAEAQALWQQLGDVRKAQARLRNRAQIWVQLGRTGEALAVLADNERSARASGDWLGRIDAGLSLAMAHRRARDWASALVADREALTLAWQRWHRHALAYGFWGPAHALARLRRPRAAARLMAFAGSFWRSQYDVLSEADRREQRRVRRLVRAQIGEAATAAEWARGEALDPAAALALVLDPGGAD
jgi:predicted ATPase